MDKAIFISKNRRWIGYNSQAGKRTSKEKCSIRRREHNTKKSDCYIHAPLRKRLEAVYRLKGEHSLNILCKVLNVNRSSYYKHYNSKEAKRNVENKEIRKYILLIYSSHNKRPGAYKIKYLLKRDYSISISVGRVYRLLKGMNLPKMSTINPKITNTKTSSTDEECHNYLKQNFKWERPNSAWCSDFTYIKTKNGWCYLCVVIDLFSRKVISWSLSTKHNVSLIKEAFIKAFKERGEPKGLLFHSDRGSEYNCKEFRDLLDKSNVLQSFSAKGYPYDNSVCESFFKYLKLEQINRHSYSSIKDLRMSIFEYIDCTFTIHYIHLSQYQTIWDSFKSQHCC